MYRLAYRLTGNQHDAEDLTQETFVRVFRSLHSYTPGHVRGLAAPHHDQPLPRPGAPQAAHPDGRHGRGRRALRLRRPAAPPERAFEHGNLDLDIQRALDQLPPEYRAAVVLCDIEGLSYEEIAVTLGIKLGTVRSRIHRARARLRVSLAHRAPTPSPPPTLPTPHR